MTDRFQLLLDKGDLLDLVNRYARGLDRCDMAQLKAVFFDDAMVDMISFAGNAHRFSDNVSAIMRTTTATTSHLTSNCLFDVDGDRATGESYLISVSVMKGAGVGTPVVHIGRYHDRFERREGVWKIAHRSIAIDLEISGAFPDGIHAVMPTGDEKRHPEDPSYALAAWLGARI